MMSNYYPVKFSPISMERIWGGHRLKPQFGEHREAPVGEYWVLSGHPNGTSVVTNGELAGTSLTQLCELYPKAYLGNSPQNRFPLLIKFLEARTDLSVQIHPDDLYAKEHEGDFGKTEAWYIVDCDSDGKVNYGHRFDSRENYLQSVEDGSVRDYLVYQNVKPGQVVFVPARTLHALLAGTTVIEIQQTSDVTYRVYDWDRVDSNGQGRELHIQQAADVLRFDHAADAKAISTSMVITKSDTLFHERLVECPYFTLEKLTARAGTHVINRGKPGNPDVLIVADGNGRLRWADGEMALAPGDTVLVPATLDSCEIITSNQMVVLRTYY